MLLNLIFLHLSCRNMQDNLSLVHHIAFIGQLECKVEILFNEQDRKISLSIKALLAPEEESAPEKEESDADFVSVDIDAEIVKDTEE